MDWTTSNPNPVGRPWSLITVFGPVLQTTLDKMVAIIRLSLVSIWYLFVPWLTVSCQKGYRFQRFACFVSEKDELSNRSIAIPQDQMFWDDLFADAKKWGLEMYEQDWLDVQYLKMK